MLLLPFPCLWQTSLIKLSCLVDITNWDYSAFPH